MPGKVAARRNLRSVGRIDLRAAIVLAAFFPITYRVPLFCEENWLFL
jgi:hypothetical protein